MVPPVVAPALVTGFDPELDVSDDDVFFPLRLGYRFVEEKVQQRGVVAICIASTNGDMFLAGCLENRPVLGEIDDHVCELSGETQVGGENGVNLANIVVAWYVR